MFMHRVKKILIRGLFILIFIAIEIHLSAQGCSQCRAQIISSNKEDLSVGNGINTGIIFLMIVPYIILFFLFRKQIFSFFRQLRAAK